MFANGRKLTIAHTAQAQRARTQHSHVNARRRKGAHNAAAAAAACGGSQLPTHEMRRTAQKIYFNTADAHRAFNRVAHAQKSKRKKSIDSNGPDMLYTHHAPQIIPKSRVKILNSISAHVVHSEGDAFFVGCCVCCCVAVQLAICGLGCVRADVLWPIIYGALLLHHMCCVLVSAYVCIYDCKGGRGGFGSC